jgi:hypothetical protein
MKRYSILAYDRDREVVVAECDTRPEEILKAVRQKVVRQQSAGRTFYINRYGDARIKQNY